MGKDIAPYNESAKEATTRACNFLSKICVPAAEEFGLMLKDQVKAWRESNLTKIANKAENMLREHSTLENLNAHPRLVHEVMDKGSWIDVDEVQDLWAGLLASSCTEDGYDESNLHFMNVLSQLTTSQVAILNHTCKNCHKGVSDTGFIYAHEYIVTLDELQAISGIQDIHRIDRELDHLRSLEILNTQAGFKLFDPEPIASISPSAFTLHMYARCQGFYGSPIEFYGLSSESKDKE